MPRRHLAAVLALLTLASMTALVSPAAAVYGGTAAEQGEYPAMTWLLSGDGSVGCPGTLVRATKVVTSAICANEIPEYAALDYTSLDAIGGVGQQGSVYGVVSVAIHPNFTGDVTDGFNVGVVTLGDAALQSPVALARPAQSLLWAAGNDATILGWGVTSNESGGLFSDVLQEATLLTLTDADCGTQAGGRVGCVDGPAEQDAAACDGDYGGPVLVGDAAGDPVLIGVLSFNSGAGCSGASDSYFTRVGDEAVYDWVKTQFDVLGPRVTSVRPTGTGVDRDVRLRADFNEPMQRSSISPTTFKLQRILDDGSTRLVENVTVGLSNDLRFAVLNPFGASSGRLAPRTRYRAVVTTEARDLEGNRLDQHRDEAGRQPKVWEFKTGGD